MDEMKARAVASLTLVGTLAIALLIVLGDGAAAEDKDDFLPTFRATYPAAAGTRLDSCSLCHFTNSEGKWDENQYAEDFEDADKNFIAVQALDSDGDGFTNYQEIQAGTLPGVASDNPNTVVTTTTIAAPAGSGEAIYQANCAGCHGGNGGNLVPTSLTLSQLVNTTAKGTVGMNGFSGTLTPAEIDLVAGYLFNWSGTPAPTTTTIPGTVPNGAEVWAQSCAGCHGSNGGNLIGRGLSAGQVASVTAAGTSGMPGFSASLSTAQIDAVAAYVASLAPPPTTTTAPGSPPPSGSAVWAASCAGCHGSGGGDLAGRGLGASRVVSVTTSGTSGMPGFSASLSTAEIDAVAAYVASLAGVAPTTTTLAPDAPPPSGAAVFAEWCAICHGDAGGDLVGHSLSTDRLWDATANGDGSMPGFTDRLSTEHIDAVVAYLASLRADDSVLATDTGEEELIGDDPFENIPEGAFEEESEERRETAELSLAADEPEDGESPFIIVSMLVVLVAIVGGVGAMWLRSARVLAE